MKSISKDDETTFRNLYEDGFTGKEISEKTGFSQSAVFKHLREIGVEMRSPREKDSRSQHEEELIRELYPQTDTKVLADKLGRAVQTIHEWASKLEVRKDEDWLREKNIEKLKKTGIEPFSQEELQVLKEEYPTTPTSELAEKLDRCIQTLHSKASKLGIRKEKWWSEKEEEELRRLVREENEKTWKEIADLLSRPAGSVKDKAYKLGLKKGRESMYKDFDRNNIESLSYVLGVCYGDGWVTETKRKKYRIGLGTIDIEFAKSFKEKLINIDLNPRLYDSSKTYQKNPLSKSKKFYTVEANSKKFYLWYNELDKADLINFLESEKSISEFLRGIYESEGSYQEKSRNRLQLSICNTDLELLKIVRGMGKRIGVEFNLYPSSKNGSKRRKDKWSLQLSNRKEVLTFLNRVKPVIPRKTNKELINMGANRFE